jgi:DNA methylase
VLDSFCGCGTTIHAAQELKRDWIGIDITHLAISLIEKRLNDAFPGIKYEVHGTPKAVEGASPPGRCEPKLLKPVIMRRFTANSPQFRY